ncbi:MAG: hypothetical protein ABIJ41_04850 [Candidatus Omnitrophota bacterium]
MVKSCMTTGLLRLIAFLGILIFVYGCASSPNRSNQDTASNANPKETTQDVRSAVEAIADSVSGQKVQVTYCPLCGRHYSGRVKICPVDQTPLEILEE